MTNVVLIALDSLRSDRLGCYGYQKDTSPFLDGLATRSVLFENCFAPNIPTHPSFTTMLSGREAISHNIVNIGAEGRINEGVRLLPEILQEHGYRTMAVDNLERHFSRGFDQYVTYQWDRSDPTVLRKAETVTEAALPLIENVQQGDNPFFLFLHYWDPHTPYLPPPPYHERFYLNGRDPYDVSNRSMDEAWSWEPFKWYFHQWIPGVTDAEYVNSLYDGEIAYMDYHLERVFQALGPRMDETLVIVTADHGEILNDQLGYYDHHGLYDANIRVPLIIHWPGELPEGRRTRGMVQNLDLAPTILDVVGIPRPHDMEGLSLLPTLVGPQEGNYEEIYCSEATWELKRAIRTQRWKLIVSLEPDPHGRPMQELFDLEADPAEQTNVIDRFPEVARDLEVRLHEWVSRRIEETGRTADPLLEQGICATGIGTQIPGEVVGPGAVPLHERTNEQAPTIPLAEGLRGQASR